MAFDATSLPFLGRFWKRKTEGPYHVLCVKWGKKFPADYVNRLYNMVQRNTTVPHRFICFTEDGAGLQPGIETRGFSRDLEYCWNKLVLFEKMKDLRGVALYLDLDVVITGNIDEMFTCRPRETFLGVLDWNRPHKPQYNSSVMRFVIGRHARILRDFDRGVARGKLVKVREYDKYLKSDDKVVYMYRDKKKKKRRHKSDQEWISARIFPREELGQHVFDPRWVLSYKAHAGGKGLPGDCRVMVFHGEPKPHEVDEEWVRQHWR